MRYRRIAICHFQRELTIKLPPIQGIETRSELKNKVSNFFKKIFIHQIQDLYLLRSILA
jgi:hypothetical protein